MKYFSEEFLNEKFEKWLFLLKDEELAENTIKRYKINITSFIDFAKGKEISKDTIREYKNKLDEEKKYLTSTANNYILTVNSFLKFMGYENLQVKLFNSQQKTIDKEYIDYSDYHRLLRISERHGYKKINMIMQILAETGIRISELKFFTVDNLNDSMVVKNKGKKRIIILSKKLLKKVKKYCKENHISTGYIFPGKDNSKPYHDSSIRKGLKKIAGLAKVKLEKVHPHSFRHYFAVQYLDAYPDDLATLSILLGHSSMETTKIYLNLSDKQKERKLRNVKF